jgi:hypothetical protein
VSEIETVNDLEDALEDYARGKDPVFVESPHGCRSLFVVERVERQVADGEPRVVLRLREVAR